MNFKNLYIFAFTRPFTTTRLDLESALSEHAFTPCGSTEQSHYGFVPAFGKGSESLSIESSGNILIRARKEEKILPAPVIKDMVDIKIDEFEIDYGRSSSKKERDQIKDDVIFELLPRAFSRITDTRAYISAKDNLIVIDTASRGKAEDLMSLLRKAIGTLTVTSFTPETAPDEVMTDWLQSNIDSDDVFKSNLFELGSDATFTSSGEGGAEANVKNQNMHSAEVQAHIDSDKYVTKIGLEYDKSMSFILHDDLSIKRLKFSDVLMEQNDDIDSDDKLARLDADFALIAGEINRMLVDLLAEFGLKTDEYLEK